MAYDGEVRFTFNPAKSEQNRKKHGISFEEAESLFTSGAPYLDIYDEAHSETEDRFLAIGPTDPGIIAVVYTERDGDTIRIISARRATSTEKELYRQHVGGKRT